MFKKGKMTKFIDYQIIFFDAILAKRTVATYMSAPISGFKDGGGVTVPGYIEFTGHP